MWLDKNYSDFEMLELSKSNYCSKIRRRSGLTNGHRHKECVKRAIFGKGVTSQVIFLSTKRVSLGVPGRRECSDATQ